MFVDHYQKKLCSDDLVLFIKHRSGELFVGICLARKTAGGGIGRWKMGDGRGRGREEATCDDVMQARGREREREKQRLEGFWAGAGDKREGERKRVRGERDGGCWRRSREIERGKGRGRGSRVERRWPQQGTRKEKEKREERRGGYFGYFWKCR
ncbi:hypothetical protein AAC387_Pa04g1474 [Persea americana]